MIVLRFVPSRLVLRSLARPDEIRARVKASRSISLRLSTSRLSPEGEFRPALIAIAASILAASPLRHDVGTTNAGHHCACTVPVRYGLPGRRLRPIPTYRTDGRLRPRLVHQASHIRWRAAFCAAGGSEAYEGHMRFPLRHDHPAP